MTRAETVDDDDMGALFRDYKAMRQRKRADNRESSADMLRQAGIAFQSNNAGAHLVVNHGGVTVDFWPGTGLWCIRGSTAQHRGVNRLLSRLHAQENAGVKR
jgi:hypothetical protein